MKNGFCVGIDVGSTNIKSALMKNDKIIKRMRISTHADKEPAALISQIKRAILSFAEPISHIGIGIAGIIDSENGIVKYSPNLTGWTDVKLAQKIMRDLKVPVKILNDVNAICLGDMLIINRSLFALSCALLDAPVGSPGKPWPKLVTLGSCKAKSINISSVFGTVPVSILRS